jgi:hypothetical protein
MKDIFKRYLYSLFLILFFTTNIFAQELNCTVKINFTQVQGVDPQIFKNLEKAVFEFMNNRKWTNEVYTPEEKIECSIFFNITSATTTSFSGTMLVQSRRPVFNSSYNSVTLNLQDENIAFEYSMMQNLDFTVNQYNNNLTSLLGYYAYIIIAVDHDAFAPLGGSKFYEQALQVVVNAQNGSGAGPGWKAFENDRNRYWLVTNFLNETYAPLRNLIYNYHMKGLDQMHKDKDGARREIIASISGLESLHRVKPLSYNSQVVLGAKADEIVNIFTEASSADKTKVVQLLGDYDPGNGTKYNKILTGK